MARNTGGNPKSYEDIVRATVVDPDSSVRPTRDQEQEAREGYRAVDADEQVLHGRVLHALATSGADVSQVTVEVARDLVTLGGRIPDAAMLRALEDAVAGVAGVDTVHNQVVVGQV
jgi:osmotically-inducible protein OsmY